MKHRVALPFLTLSSSAVAAADWEISVDGADWSVAGDFLPHWDAASDVRLRRKLCLHHERAASDLGIPVEHLRIAASVRIGTGQGRLPRRILFRLRKELREDDPSWDLEHTIEGHQLSMLLDLQTEILMLRAPGSYSPLSPLNAEDRLWSENTRMRIEGEEPRFPIETADLAQMLGGSISSSAPWYLHWSPRDWGRDFHGAVRLYLNKRAAETLGRVEAEDPATIRFLLGDVMSQICERFLSDPEAEIMMKSPEPGSLGAQAVIWLRRAWPGKDASFIRSVLESRPGIFRAAILDLAEPGCSE